MAFDHSVYTHTSNTFHIVIIRWTYIYQVLLKVQIFLVVHFGSIAWECVIRVYTAIFGLQNIFVAWKGKENNNMLQFLAPSSCQRPYRRPTWYKNMLNIDTYTWSSLFIHKYLYLPVLWILYVEIYTLQYKSMIYRVTFGE